jgi:hypothetical protein
MEKIITFEVYRTFLSFILVWMSNYTLAYEADSLLKKIAVAPSLIAPTVNVCGTSGYIKLPDFGFQENVANDFTNNQYTLVLSVSANFELKPNTGSIDITTSGGGITNGNIAVSKTQILISFLVNNMASTDRILLKGIEVSRIAGGGGDIRISLINNALPAPVVLNAILVTLDTSPRTIGTTTITGTGVSGGALTVCTNQNTTLSANVTLSGNNTNPYYRWYSDANLSTLLSESKDASLTDLGIDITSPQTVKRYALGAANGGANPPFANCASTTATEITITIAPPPVVALTKNVGNNACVNSSATFTAISTNVSEFRFEMTRNGNAYDDQDFSATSTYTFNFTETGNYSVIVIGRNGSCQATSSAVSLNVVVSPVVAFKNTPISFAKSPTPAENIKSLRDYVTIAGGTFSSANASVNAAIFDRDQINISTLNPNSYPLTYTYTDPSTGCSSVISGAGILGIVGDNSPNNSIIKGIQINQSYCENDAIGENIRFEPATFSNLTFAFDSIRSDNFPNAIVKSGSTYRFNPQAVTIPEGVSSINVSLVLHYGVLINNSPNPNIIIPNLAFPFIVTVTRKPIALIKPSGFCQGSTTNFDAVFTSLVNTPPNSPSPIYLWNFDDPNDAEDWATGPKTNTHTYTQPGSYEVKLIITNGQTGCVSDTIKQVVSIFPNIVVNNNNLYIQNFEANDHGWREQGAKNTWGLGIPSANRNVKASNRIWSTMLFDTQNQNIGGPDSSYANSQQSFVECPCLNIDGIDRPLLSMSIWSDTDISSDGASLQVTYDDGENWENVGEVGDGLEWYNRKNILGLPSGSVNPDREGWTGKDLGWRKARFPLDDIKASALGKKIRFRVFFGSNADNPPDKYDGFAFDSVSIESRNRQSILEYFTSTNPIDSIKNENTFINAFPDPQDELTNIQYHTNFAGDNPLNRDNTADPSARALYYGVSKAPRAAIDGFSNANAKFSIWGPKIFNQKTLTPSPFEITVNFPNNPASQLNVEAQIKALQDFNRPIIIHTVVVEKTIDQNDLTPPLANNHINVVKKMLPDAAGLFYNQAWLAGSTQTFSQSLTLYELTQSNVINPKVYNTNQLAVVVFVQDDETKEIYQSSVITTPSVAPPLVSGIEDPILKKLRMFPNPTQQELNLEFAQILGSDYQWEIYNYWGAKVMNGKLDETKNRTTFKVDNLAKGMYMVKIINRRSQANITHKLIIN